MREVLLSAASTAALIAVSVGPTRSQDLVLPGTAVAPSCYVQALAGSAISTAKAESAATLPVSVSASGWTVGLGVGCDVKLDRIVIGALARIELPVEMETSIIDADKSWMAGFRLGYMVNPHVLAYGLAGYAQHDWRVDATKLNPNGIVLGGGLEVALTKQLSLTAEYTRTGLGTLRDTGVEIKPVDHSARLGLSFRFGSLFGE